MRRRKPTIMNPHPKPKTRSPTLRIKIARRKKVDVNRLFFQPAEPHIPWDDRFYFICFYRPSSYVILSVRPSVCLSVSRSVTHVLSDKTKQCTADILIPHETAITLVFWHQQWLVGDAPLGHFVWNLRSKWPTPSKNADFDRFPLVSSQP